MNPLEAGRARHYPFAHASTPMAAGGPNVRPGARERRRPALTGTIPPHPGPRQRPGLPKPLAAVPIAPTNWASTGADACRYCLSQYQVPPPGFEERGHGCS
jgi:hypothetical protein